MPRNLVLEGFYPFRLLPIGIPGIGHAAQFSFVLGIQPCLASIFPSASRMSSYFCICYFKLQDLAINTQEAFYRRGSKCGGRKA